LIQPPLRAENGCATVIATSHGAGRWSAPLSCVPRMPCAAICGRPLGLAGGSVISLCTRGRQGVARAGGHCCEDRSCVRVAWGRGGGAGGQLGCCCGAAARRCRAALGARSRGFTRPTAAAWRAGVDEPPPSRHPPPRRVVVALAQPGALTGGSGLLRGVGAWPAAPSAREREKGRERAAQLARQPAGAPLARAHLTCSACACCHQAPTCTPGAPATRHAAGLLVHGWSRPGPLSSRSLTYRATAAAAGVVGAWPCAQEL